MIICKYENHPQLKNENKLLRNPIQRKNERIFKRIAGVCEFKKELTFHVARHTFAKIIIAFFKIVILKSIVKYIKRTRYWS